MSNAIGFACFCICYGWVCYAAWRYMGLPYKDSSNDGEVNARTE